LRAISVQPSLVAPTVATIFALGDVVNHGRLLVGFGIDDARDRRQLTAAAGRGQIRSLAVGEIAAPDIAGSRIW
jgi:hypothetical protein